MLDISTVFPKCDMRSIKQSVKKVVDSSATVCYSFCTHTASQSFFILKDVVEILRLTGPHEAVDLVSLTSRKIVQRLISGRALQLIADSDLSNAFT
ncbi:hypothetical protein T06_12453 [Trichinella sp. T6]|nr:hypothetical protein T06_12453 [Trichinella sp. T6]